MVKPMLMIPKLHEKMWGGTRLAEYGYQLPSDHTGECWAISAHPHGPAEIANGPYQGMTLDQVWQDHPEAFGNPTSPVFPLLTKILDASRDLSVQVHPDDAYAKAHAGELGKTECWYILDAAPGAVIYYGHHAQTRAELAQMIEAHQWDRLLRTIPVHPGDFFYVPAGTVHALGKGIVALETQQSSDTTYRFYDFDRVDPATGHKRELHIQDSLNCITVPHRDPVLEQSTRQVGAATVTTLVEAPHFTVRKITLTGGTANFARHQDPYTLMSVVAGTGSLTLAGRSWPLKKGTHLILPHQAQQWQLAGDMTVIEAAPGPAEH